MSIRVEKVHYALILCAVILVAISLFGVTKIRGQKELPKVVSKVGTVEVVSTTIKGEEPTTFVAVEIRNNSDKPILAVTVESRNENEASGITLNNFGRGDGPPRVVLKPHESTVIELPYADIKHGAGIQVGAVMYADGTEEGDGRTLKTMRGQREHDAAENLKKKGARP